LPYLTLYQVSFPDVTFAVTVTLVFFSRHITILELVVALALTLTPFEDLTLAVPETVVSLLELDVVVALVVVFDVEDEDEDDEDVDLRLTVSKSPLIYPVLLPYLILYQV